MKFLFELVSCCYSRPLKSPTPTTDETQFLVPSNKQSTPPATSALRNRSRKRGRVAAANRTVDWRPSLHPISEVQASPTVRDERPVNTTERSIKRKLASRAKAHFHNHTTDHGRVSLPAIIPTYCPVPFLI